MRLDKFTTKSQEALQAAQQFAESKGHPELLPEHLGVALLEQEGGIVVPILGKLGVPPDRVRGELERDLRKLPSVSGGSSLGMGARFRSLMEAARKEADGLKDDYVSAEHFLLALSAEARALKEPVDRLLDNEVIPCSLCGGLMDLSAEECRKIVAEARAYRAQPR